MIVTHGRFKTCLESETEETATDDVQKSVATALLNAETKSNSSLESEKEEVINEPPNNDTESNLPQITLESPVPDAKSSESEADVENSPSIEHSESEQKKSSSSSSESESENEAVDKHESANRSPTSKPVSPDNKSADEPVVKSLETENLTNGDTCETTANFETGIDNTSGSEKVLSKKVENLEESAEEASNDEANEGETEETEIEKVSKVEVQSYTQLVTPAGYGSGFAATVVAAVEAGDDGGNSGGGGYDGGYSGGGGYDGGYSGGGGYDGGYSGGSGGGGDGGGCGGE